MNHASIVLQYEKRLKWKYQKANRSGTDPEPEAEYPEARPFCRIKLARNTDRDNIWKAEQISNRDVYNELIELQKEHEIEEQMNKGNVTQCE